MQFNPQSTDEVLTWIEWVKKSSAALTPPSTQEVLWQKLCHQAFMNLHGGDLYTLAKEIAGGVNGDVEAHNSRVLLFFALAHLLHMPNEKIYDPGIVVQSMGAKMPTFWTLRITMFGIVSFCVKREGNENFTSREYMGPPIWQAGFERACRDQRPSDELLRAAETIATGRAAILKTSMGKLASFIAAAKPISGFEIPVLWWHRLIFALHRAVADDQPGFNAATFAKNSEGVFRTQNDVMKAINILVRLFTLK